MYDYISHEKVLTALRWLKENNPLYADIDINEEWLEQAMSNDEDLFSGLVLNSESVLPTQQPHNESSINTSNCSSNQFVNKDDSQSMECNPHSLSIHDDVFSIAFNLLEQVARENGFAIHNVPLILMVIACLAA